MITLLMAVMAAELGAIVALLVKKGRDDSLPALQRDERKERELMEGIRAIVTYGGGDED